MIRFLKGAFFDVWGLFGDFRQEKLDKKCYRNFFRENGYGSYNRRKGGDRDVTRIDQGCPDPRGCTDCEKFGPPKISGYATEWVSKLSHQIL